MSLARTQSPYPEEAAARAAVARELEWVKTHVLDGKDGGVARVEDVQQFAMIAPGPSREEEKTRMQRTCV